MFRSRFNPLHVLALLVIATLTGCFGTDGGKDKSNPCAADASLCTPRGDLRDTGAVVFIGCAGCHGENGEGGRGPNVANSDFVMNPAYRERLIHIVLAGNMDSLRVNGVFVPGGGMPEHTWLTDLEIAGALTYIRSVLNDTLVTDCAPQPEEEFEQSPCVRTARTATEMDLDSVAVWEVKAVRDTLTMPE
jgi:mono/diheme cytochrome c family protein